MTIGRLMTLAVFAAMFVVLGADVIMHGIAFTGGDVPAIHHALVVPPLLLFAAATIRAARDLPSGGGDVQD